MNMRFVAICLMMTSLSVWAQDPVTPERSAMVERAAFVQTLKRGKPLTVNKQHYQHLPEVFAAVQPGQKTPPQELLAQVGATPDSLIETKGQYTVYRSGQPQDAPYVTRMGSVTVYPTVLNGRTGSIGILLGNVVAKLKNMDQAKAIATSHGFELVREFPHLQVVIYAVKENQDVLQVSESLASDPRITSARPEILEHMLAPN